MSHRPFLAGRALNSAEMLNLVGQIYACASEPAEIEGVLRALNGFLGGTSAQMFTRDVATGLVIDSHVSDPGLQDAAQSYINHWGKLDPRLEALSSLGPREVFRCHEHFDEAFVAKDPFFQRHLIPKGLRWSLAAMFPSGPGLVTVITDMREASSSPFDDAAAQTMRQLLPHFERAWALGAKIERQGAAVRCAADAVKLLPTPCLFTDQVGRCMEGNEAFSNALGPLSLHLVTGRVRFVDPALQVRWEAALYEAHATALPTTMKFSTAEGKEWKVHLLPWQSPAHALEPVERRLILAVFDDKTAQQVPQTGSMAAVARLTRAEAEVLAGLLKGLPAKVIATRRSASVHTVRSQIVAILEKTGYNSQKELMASFGSSVLPESAFTNSVLHSEH